MERNFQQIEDLLRKSLNTSRMAPSPGVLRKLKFRLWVNDYFSLNPRKVNVLYTALLVGAVSTLIWVMPDQTGTEEQSFASGPEERREPLAITHAEDMPDQAGSGEKAVITGNLSAGYTLEKSKGCAPFTVKFSNRSVLASRYNWDFGTGDHSAEVNPEYTFREPGRYNVILTATGKDGKIATYRNEITVLESPKADFSIDKEKSDVTTREIHFLNHSTGASVYEWSFGDRYESKADQPVHAYKDYKSYKVTLVAMNQEGCSDTSYLVNKFIEKNYALSFPLNFRPSPFNRGDNGYYERAGSDAAIFYPKNNGVLEYKLSITAPNGMEVFTTENIKQGWNGYIGGRIAPRGIYSYTVSGVFPNGKAFAYRGRVEILVDDYY